MAELGRRKPGDERRLRRTERAVPDTPDERGGECGCRRVRGGQTDVTRRESDACDGRRRTCPDAVDDRACGRRRDDARAGERADDETGDAEREPAPVVQVDDLEREYGAPAECVEEEADLDEPELLGEPQSESFVIVHNYY